MEKQGFRTLCFGTHKLQEKLTSEDFYGSGRSACPRVEYKLDFYVEQIYELLTYLDLLRQPIVFIGSSMGGLVAAAFSMKYPDIVRSLVLTNPAGVPTPFREYRRYGRFYYFMCLWCSDQLLLVLVLYSVLLALQ